MKKRYSKPVFFVEGFSFSESIAACQYHVGDPDNHVAILVEKGDCVCYDVENGTSDSGHKAICTDYVFNDGAENYNGCTFDWSGDGAAWSQHFYGNNSGNSARKHAPAYQGMILFS